MDANFETTIEVEIYNNASVEIFQSQETGFYGLNVKIGKFNIKTPAKFENLEDLQKIVKS